MYKICSTGQHTSDCLTEMVSSHKLRVIWRRQHALPYAWMHWVRLDRAAFPLWVHAQSPGALKAEVICPRHLCTYTCYLLLHNPLLQNSYHLILSHNFMGQEFRHFFVLWLASLGDIHVVSGLIWRVQDNFTYIFGPLTGSAGSSLSLSLSM